MDADGRVALFNLNPGEVRHEFFLSCLNLVVQDSQTSKHIGGVYPRIASGNLGIHRNEAAMFFYNDLPFEWMWFVDSDIQLAASTLDKLMKVADPKTAPIVSGLYINVGIDGNIVPMVYNYGKAGEQTKFYPYTPNEIASYIENEETILADGTGAGCLLIHRSVIERMVEYFGLPMPMFGNDIAEDVVNGEDFTFCLRAKKLNYPIHVICFKDLSHIKPHAITAQHLIEVSQKETSDATAG